MNRSITHQTIHNRATDLLHRKPHTTYTPVKDLGDDFHVYAMQWDAKKMEMFIDDRKTFEFENDGGGMCERAISAMAGRPRSAVFQRGTGAFRPWLDEDHDISHTLLA